MKYAIWIKVTKNKDDHRKKCSDCNFIVNSWLAHVYNYCPNCGAKMSKAPYICECYRESVEFYYKNDYRKSQRVVGRCMGTKEREECACDGDESMCDFYPEKRGKVNDISNQ